MDKYITPDQVCDLIPGMTKGNLAALRFNGKGPAFFKPTPRTVVYRERDVVDWLEASRQTSTLGATA
ncbi:helix-turn-helix transcriptional regulator [Microbacterium sp. NPDC087589]|uniref:helix-turn-helix transcriptional regulator n=1 Tax=Microbacterium sp. NPDC087589 TaxID=3364191 RepID=UPI00380FB81F